MGHAGFVTMIDHRQEIFNLTLCIFNLYRKEKKKRMEGKYHRILTKVLEMPEEFFGCFMTVSEIQQKGKFKRNPFDGKQYLHFLGDIE